MTKTQENALVMLLLGFAGLLAIDWKIAICVGLIFAAYASTRDCEHVCDACEMRKENE